MILHALGDLPDHLDTEFVDRAEAHLLDQAADFDAKALKILGRRILDLLAPDAADADEAKLLDREERDAAAATRLVMWDDGHGKTHGRFTLDTLTGAMLKKALYAIAAPRHQKLLKDHSANDAPPPNASAMRSPSSSAATRSTGSPRPAGSTPPSRCPPTTNTLRGDLKAAHLDTGEPISPGAARQLARPKP